MALSPAEMQDAIIRNLRDRTGRTLDEWIAAVLADGPGDRRGRVAWLKETHGVGHVTAQVIAVRAEGGGSPYAEADALLDALFGSPGSPARRRYEALRDELAGIVPGTRVTVCRGYVGFATRRQYAAVRLRGDRLQVGLRLDADGELLAPVRGLGGGAITAAFVADGPLDAARQDLVRRAAGLVPVAA